MNLTGQIAHYNNTKAAQVDNFLVKTIYKHVRIEGFIFSDYVTPESAQKFFNDVATFIKDGKVKYKEHIVKGFDTVPNAFISLFHGANTGKIVVQL